SGGAGRGLGGSATSCPWRRRVDLAIGLSSTRTSPSSTSCAATARETPRRWATKASSRRPSASGGTFTGSHAPEEEEADADHDGGVGGVEHGPDPQVDEVDH